MNMIKLTINGKELTGESGKTILDIARENGIEIPTLCHDERLESVGSCGICTVEVEGSPRLFRSCSTAAADGMKIHTDTERIRRNRKTVLELLLSDHCGDCRPPCSLACPADTDCMGYAKLVANGDYAKARELIMEKVPFPASIGRVCPRPCEKECRRGLIEESIAIASIKQFVGDNTDMGTLPEINPTNKTVAVIGGGPGGLSAAYYLRLKGHSVTVFEAQPEMGGMLRYGIPDYRLPKDILKKETDVIEKSGVEFRNNTKVTLSELQGKYDAVIVAVGAWTSTGLRCSGEDLDGVVNGIEFLYDYAIGKAADLKGKKVAVVGGGNTAMDASRTALRLGADEVYLVYRRTRAEMPADTEEIHDAEKEGVIFKFLTNPIDITGNNKAEKMRLQVMELGEPDSSGRRSPVPVKGKEEVLDVDIVIPAIGQKANLDGFGEVETTKWGTITADEHTLMTSIKGVFAVGDATNNGADIAVSAIGEGRRCAESVDRFLNGEVVEYKKPFLVKTEKTAEDFADYKKQSRCKDSKEEAGRCLECGCAAYHDCKLIKYANEYDVHPERLQSEIKRGGVPKDDHDKIVRNPEKCVLCGLCVRVCDTVENKNALGFSGRGFEVEIKPAVFSEHQRLCETECDSCGECVLVCPTGALVKVR